MDTIGTQLAVLYREVSLIQSRYVHSSTYVVGTVDTVILRKVSLTQSVLYREVPLYTEQGPASHYLGAHEFHCLHAP